jgi:hypothetical protein
MRGAFKRFVEDIDRRTMTVDTAGEKIVAVSQIIAAVKVDAGRSVEITNVPAYAAFEGVFINLTACLGDVEKPLSVMRPVHPFTVVDGKPDVIRKLLLRE